jgi:M6 family metalloprotease-like protein
MPNSRYYYDNNFSKAEVMAMVKTEAETQLSVDLDLYDKIGFIYAGDGRNYYGGTEAGGSTNFSSDEKYKGTFSHIGITAHEFAHTIGADDEYYGEVDPHFWSLMSQGLRNGPNYGTNIGLKGNCPAPFSPAYRIKFNWIVPQLVQAPVSNLIVEYSDTYPIFYKVDIPASDEYFIIERRRKNGFDRYTPTKEVENIDFPPPGILIWHIAPSAPLAEGRYSDLVELEFADNHNQNNNDRFPYPITSSQSFSHFTLPSSNKRSGDNSQVEINNITLIQETGSAKIDVNITALQINGYQSWNEDIELDQSVIIHSESTLEITQGVDINIVGSYSSEVKFYIENGGTLLLNGTTGNEITINSTTKWGGIVIYGNGIFQGDYCTLSNAKKTFEMLDENSSCTINNSKILDAEQGCFIQGNISINNTSFENATVVIEYSNSGSCFTNCTFSSDILNQYGIGLVNPVASYLLVKNCTFNGFHLGLLFGKEGGTNFDRTQQITILNNIISNCQKSIDIQFGAITINYNNFYNNGENNFPGSNYLMVNPLYVNPVNNDFNLQWESGCIDAGNPVAIYNDPDGTRNDMGGLFYDQSPVVPTNFYFLKDVNNHPELHWTGAAHLNYKIYAQYKLYEGGILNVIYTATAETYTDITVMLVNPRFANQQVKYSVISVNNLSEESEHSIDIRLQVYGGVWKEALLDSNLIPIEYNLFPAYPNPFNPSTNIVFDLPENSPVTLKVYSVTGEEIKTLVNNTLTAGRHRVVFEGNGIPSGIYFVRIETKDYLNTKKLILMK